MAPALPPKNLQFAGYAALFHVADAARDIIRPGAFLASLKARKTPLPLLWQHQWDMRIGTIEYAEEDARGLRIIARLGNPSSLAAHMLQRGRVNGLSFGYQARRYHQEGDNRILDEVMLHEVSLVTRPLQHGARVHLRAA